MTTTVSLTKVTHLTNAQILSKTDARENCVYISSDLNRHFEGQRDGTARECFYTMSELRTHDHSHSVNVHPLGFTQFTTDIYVPNTKRIRVGVGTASTSLDVDYNIRMRLNPADGKFLRSNANGGGTWEWGNGDGTTAGSVLRGAGKMSNTTHVANSIFHFRIPLQPSTNTLKWFHVEMTGFFPDNTEKLFKGAFYGQIDAAGTGLQNTSVQSIYGTTDITFGSYIGTLDRLFIWIKPVTNSSSSVSIDNFVPDGGVRLDPYYYATYFTTNATI